VWQRQAAVLFAEVATEPAYWRRGEAAQAGLRAAFGLPVMVEGRVVSVVDFLAVEAPDLNAAREAMFAALGRQIGLFFQRCEAEERVRVINAELEARVEQRTAQLAAANEDLEAFSYSVSHDLRAPLRAVGGFSRALQEDFGSKLEPEAQRYLEHIQRSAEQMRQLIADLLAFSRLGRHPLTKDRVDTGALVQAVVAELAPTWEGRTLVVRLGELPPCDGDRALLRQVWFNLIENAVKYTRRQAAAEIEIGAAEGANEQIFHVRDNGAGFDPRYADRLFGVFQRLHRAEEFEGTGIGLANVKRIAERHGGRVWADATPGQGATFFFALPRNDRPLPGA
jgi:light-regulated signal transduction histidine kinase (bacteriophytochrome)